MKIICDVCPNFCRLEENQIGFCRARKNIGGESVSINYGKITSIALDPIEKKPLYRFLPNTYVLSVGSFGCNLRCPFCQNHSISMCGETAQTVDIEKEDLIEKALQLNNCSGVAFTYNEPLIGWEYVRDTAKLCKEKNLATVVVTNGYVNTNILEKVLPYIDAMNIDLKSFNPEFYKKIHGDLD
ncbi:MAG: radical SAM protein, partial [Christensenellales bacterium]